MESPRLEETSKMSLGPTCSVGMCLVLKQLLHFLSGHSPSRALKAKQLFEVLFFHRNSLALDKALRAGSVQSQFSANSTSSLQGSHIPARNCGIHPFGVFEALVPNVPRCAAQAGACSAQEGFSWRIKGIQALILRMSMRVKHLLHFQSGGIYGM